MKSSELADSKRQLGQYYTVSNPFSLPIFREWYLTIPNVSNLVHLEPFAGSGNLVRFVNDIYGNVKWMSFDIDSKYSDCIQQDTLEHFPTGYKICITNPPYLAKNSATRRKILFPKTDWEDLYQISLEKCLENCEYIAAIIPESFINSKFPKERLEHFIRLNTVMFDDTDHPTCLCLFGPKKTTNFIISDVKKTFGYYDEIKLLHDQLLQKVNKNIYNQIKFNIPNGILGVYTIDSTKEADIKFVNGKEILPEKVKSSSRSYSRMYIPGNITNEDLSKMIIELNDLVNEYRIKTHDLFLTAFKGMRKDGEFRRRLDWETIRLLISSLTLFN